MSDTFTVKLITPGVGELLKSKEMRKCVGEVAEGIQEKCGDGYSAYSFIAGTRAVSRVYTKSIHAINSDKKHNTLLKAVSSKND